MEASSPHHTSIFAATPARALRNRVTIGGSVATVDERHRRLLGLEARVMLARSNEGIVNLEDELHTILGRHFAELCVRYEEKHAATYGMRSKIAFPIIWLCSKPNRLSPAGPNTFDKEI